MRITIRNLMVITQLVEVGHPLVPESRDFMRENVVKAAELLLSSNKEGAKELSRDLTVVAQLLESGQPLSSESKDFNQVVVNRAATFMKAMMP